MFSNDLIRQSCRIAEKVLNRSLYDGRSWDQHFVLVNSADI